MPDTFGAALVPITATWADQPVAIGFFSGSSRFRWLVDTSRFTEIKIAWTLVAAGASGATMFVRYRLTDDSTPANWTLSPRADGGFVGVELGTIGLKDSGWQTLASAARGSAVYFAMLGQDGDGAADPSGGMPYMAFR